MKKFTVCLILSLVVCLIMAFPAGAAVVYKPEWNESLKKVVSDLLKRDLGKMPSGYVYYAVFANADGTVNRILYSKEKRIELLADLRAIGNYDPYPVVTSTCYVFEGTNNPNGILMRMTSPTSALVNIGCYVEDLSTADFYNIDFIRTDYNSIISTTVNKTALHDLIVTAKSIKSMGYTSESWQALQPVIVSAENLFNKVDCTQSQIDNMVTVLQSAINGLVVLPDTADFEKLVVQMEAVKDIGYTPFSWQAFTSAVASSRALLNSGNYTQEQITISGNNLRSVYNSLVLSTITPPPDPPPDYQSMIYGFGSEWLTPANAGIWENFGEARKFGLFAFAVMMVALIVTRIIKNALGIESIGVDSQNVDFGITQEKQSNYDKGSFEKKRRR